MIKVDKYNSEFKIGLQTLGFYNHLDALFSTDSIFKKGQDPQLNFHLEKAKLFEVSAVFFRKQLNGIYKPQAYLYDFTNTNPNESELAQIQKRIWTAGEVPLAIILYPTEVKIINCSKHIQKDNTPSYLLKQLKYAGKAHKLYNSNFASKLKSGLFWDDPDSKKNFNFQNSSYDVLIDWVKKINQELSKQNSKIDSTIINKIIVQSILIKYLEERQDEKGNRLFSDKYLHKFSKANNFSELLRTKGKFILLLKRLNSDFNGNIFDWDENEEQLIAKIDLSILSYALEGKNTPDGQVHFDFIKYYDFSFIPVELISRLYEEFLGENKKENGLFYTPSHLAKLLIDEAMPLKNFDKVNIKDYKILDPACGSGIFLVLAFKRLVQWWRLKNNYLKPSDKNIDELKLLLKCVYGVDYERQATKLAAFSLCLALCDELSPMQIISDLKFDDLTETNILYTDFFVNEIDPLPESYQEQVRNFEKLNELKFDIVIGNPPFNKGAISLYNNTWTYNEKSVKIPQGQIALKFLSSAISLLKPSGLQCLIIKASSLLYNSTSSEFKKLLFSELNIVQVLDFTALARNKSLWENPDVDAVAIFLEPSKPKTNKNILHVTFRRTKATVERIMFELDEYDLHYVSRKSAIEDNNIWKNNLLGGGRINFVLEKLIHLQCLENYLDKNNCEAGEGYIQGKEGYLSPDYMYELQTMPTRAVRSNGIDYNEITAPIDKKVKFVKVPPKILFEAPNIILWANIGEDKLPVFFNTISFTYKDKIIGIASRNKDYNLLKKIVESFTKFSSIYRFYIFTTSSQILISRNTALLKDDYMKLPFIENEEAIELSEIDLKIISDVDSFMQKFLRHGENSLAVKPIPNSKVHSFIKGFGKEFSKIINSIYRENDNFFSLSEIVNIEESFIATIFKYQNKSNETRLVKSSSSDELHELINKKISEHTIVRRVIRLYQLEDDTIVLIKPNQYRYWLSSIAYRDADKCISDLTNLGF